MKVQKVIAAFLVLKDPEVSMARTVNRVPKVRLASQSKVTWDQRATVDFPANKAAKESKDRMVYQVKTVSLARKVLKVIMVTKEQKVTLVNLVCVDPLVNVVYPEKTAEKVAKVHPVLKV